MRIRCRTSQGVIVLADLSSESTINDLKQAIAANIMKSADGITLKAGFPPKIVAVDDARTLYDAGIRDGEQLIVEHHSVVAAIGQTLKPTNIQQYSSGMTKSLPSNVLPRNGVATEHGVILIREMKDDNSCLFNSINYILHRQSMESFQLRKLIADDILKDPVSYNEAILGKPVSQYCEWITKPNSWGGAIELAIFSNHFQIEIDSVDIATGRIDRFGDGKFKTHAFVLYSGIHYDAVALSPDENASNEFDLTIFDDSMADSVTQAVSALSERLRKLHKYTDLANFSLKCGICNTGLKGQNEAQDHAMKTGHTKFTEYS